VNPEPTTRDCDLVIRQENGPPDTSAVDTRAASTQVAEEEQAVGLGEDAM
jgi:hypothetical protein